MESKSIKVKNNHVEVEVNSKVYSSEVVFAAGYVFLDKAYIVLDKKKNTIIVFLYPQGKRKNLKKLGLEFSNELLNYAHYFSSLRKNSEVIKLIMQRAFFSVNPSLSKEAKNRFVQRMSKKPKNETSSQVK